MRPCAHPGCSQLVSAGYCAQHADLHRQRDRYRRNSYPRESRQARGYDRQWERVRKAKLQRDPLCEDCLRADVVRPAVLVHHIESIEDRPELRLHMSNLRSLCFGCHERTHGRQQAK